MNDFDQKWCRPDYKPIASVTERRLIQALFEKAITYGTLELHFSPDSVLTVGSGDPVYAIAPPPFRTLVKMVLDPDYQVLEAYRLGRWYSVKGPLSEVLFYLESQRSRGVVTSQRMMDRASLRLHVYKQFFRPLTETRKTKSHYNTSNEFFEVLLGEIQAYSCGFFDSEHTTLESAQTHKFTKVAERAGISNQSKGRVLDIGSGWGDLGDFLFRNSLLSVDGISISSEQVDRANERFARTADDRQIQFFCSDYVALGLEESNKYDHVVSVGMLEHVGKTQYDSFFRTAFDVLKPGGTALIHSIVKQHPAISNSWVDKYIFSGGYIPQISEVLKAVERSGLKSTGAVIVPGSNYVRTLRCWLDNFCENDDMCSRMLSGKAGPASIEARQTMRVWYAYLNAVQLLFLWSEKRSDIGHFSLVKPSRY